VNYLSITQFVRITRTFDNVYTAKNMSRRQMARHKLGLGTRHYTVAKAWSTFLAYSLA